MKKIIFILLVILVLCGCEHPFDYINFNYTVTQNEVDSIFQNVIIDMQYSYTGYESPRLIEFDYTIITLTNTYTLHDELSYFIGSINLSYSVDVNNEEMIDYSLILTTHKY